MTDSTGKPDQLRAWYFRFLLKDKYNKASALYVKNYSKLNSLLEEVWAMWALQQSKCQLAVEEENKKHTATGVSILQNQ